MNKFTIFISAIIFATLLPGCGGGGGDSGGSGGGGAGVSSAQKYGDLDITIIDGNSDTEAPIPDANILVFDAASGDPVNNLTSGADGSVTQTLEVGDYQLKVSANGFSPSPPTGVPPLPVQISDSLTSDITITLYPLADAETLGTITGQVSNTTEAGLAGVLVVAEIGDSSVATISAEDGSYILHNVPAGDASLTAYLGGFNFPAISPVAVTAGAVSADQNIVAVSEATGVINGHISFTSIEGLIVDITLLHPGTREVIPGLSVYTDASANYSMTGIPDGHFEIIASLENDGYVIDPDIAVTQGIPTADVVDGNIQTKDFKVTGAIELDMPAQPIGGIIPKLSTTPSFTWHQASSYSNADYYVLEVVDESGSTIWGGFDLAGDPKVTWPKEDPITIDYNFDFTATLPTLEAGRYYQLRIYASKEDTTSPLGFKLISSTETLDGVFKVETL
ncbi:MAG: carboxypeptidase-like regulatory domain-containing protein [Pseudomonadota bacterium]